MTSSVLCIAKFAPRVNNTNNSDWPHGGMVKRQADSWYSYVYRGSQSHAEPQGFSIMVGKSRPDS